MCLNTLSWGLMVCEVFPISGVHIHIPTTSILRQGWFCSQWSVMRARETHQIQRYLGPHRLCIQSQVHLEEV